MKSVLIIALISAVFSSCGQDSISQVDSIAATPSFTQPLFPGDIGEMYRFIKNKTKRSSCKSGVVVIRFIINEDGTISNIEVKKGINEVCDSEAVKIIESMPQWSPATSDGVAVKCHYTTPVRFD